MITLIIQYVFSTLQNIYNMEMQLLMWIDGGELIWVYLTCYQVNICLFFNKFTESGISNFLSLSLSLSLYLQLQQACFVSFKLYITRWYFINKLNIYGYTLNIPLYLASLNWAVYPRDSISTVIPCNPYRAA